MRGRFAFAFAGIGVIVPCGWAEAASTCPAPLGALVAIEGRVEFREHAGATWRSAPLNVPLCPGAMVRVGDRSRATAALPDAPTYRIDQNTTFHLVSAPAKPERPAVIRLVEGALYIFSRRPRTLTIDTPLVDAAVEGTEFLVRADRSRTAVAVFEGTVAARNAHGQVRATAGQVAIAEPGRAPVSQLMVQPREAVEWALHYPPILTVLADPRAAALDMPQPIREAARRASRGDTAGALDRLEAVPLAERGASFHLHRAAILLSVGRVDEARTDIDRALAEDPDAALAYALRAVIAVAQNDNERALADGRRAVELSTGSAAAWIALSYAQQARFDLDGARDSLRTAVEAEPKDALAWARLSELWLMAGRRDRAREAAETAADLAPDLARVQSVLGFTALAEFRTQTARQAFERAVARDPGDPTSRFGLGLARIRRGDLEAGRNDIEVAVGLDPDRSLLRSYLGKAYFEERRSGLAGDQFSIAKELDPNDPTPFLYDAIRKQSENRPVEALRDLERSIELNDNRAVYRSRELLDQDRAARGTSLARIYNDLSFEQLGINEATRSLNLDPSNAAAHRFLSDVYATKPRGETTQISELLQAQLLQDININPVQPSLSETNLNIITGGGPTRVGFNEFTPVFERNQAQLNVSGMVGSNWTRGQEAVVSGIYDNLSVSAGELYYASDGFRDNFETRHTIQNIFAQAALSPAINIQAELRRRRTDEGDLRLNFDPSSFDPTLERRLERDTGRIGARFSPSPSSDFLLSMSYSTRDEETQYTNIGIYPLRRRWEQNGLQAESAYMFRHAGFNAVMGIGSYDEDTDFRLIAPAPLEDSTVKRNFSHAQNTAFLYSSAGVFEDVTITIGASYDRMQRGNIDTAKVNPKLGVRWEPSPAIAFRGAVFRTVTPSLNVNQTIQPTQIVGFSQFLDDSAGSEVWSYAIGLDARIDKSVMAGAEIARRELSIPVFVTILDRFVRRDSDEVAVRGYIYGALDLAWAVSGELRYEYYNNEPEWVSVVPSKVETIAAPLRINYFSPRGLFAGLGATLVNQHVSRNAADAPLPEGDDSFATVDAWLGYRFPRLRGRASVEVLNIFDKKFKYQDDNYRQFSDDVPISPFFPERAAVVRVTASF